MAGQRICRGECWDPFPHLPSILSEPRLCEVTRVRRWPPGTVVVQGCERVATSAKTVEPWAIHAARIVLSFLQRLGSI